MLISWCRDHGKHGAPHGPGTIVESPPIYYADSNSTMVSGLSVRGLFYMNILEKGTALSSPRKRRRMATGWSELPLDILVRIVENHMHTFDDFAKFSCVCRHWYFAASACNLEKLREYWRCQMPWLLMADGNDEIFGDNVGKVKYYAPEELDNQEYDADDNNAEASSTSSDELYQRKLVDTRNNKCYTICCPEGYGKVCWGSAYGWVVAAGLDHKMCMFNPLTKSQLSLPSRKTFPYLWKHRDNKVIHKHFLNKAVVLKVPNYDGNSTSSSAHGSHCSAEQTLVVVAFYGYAYGYRRGNMGLGHVAIAKPGDTRWMPLEWSPTEDDEVDLQDVLYDSDLRALVFVCRYGGIFLCDLWDEEKPPSLKCYVPFIDYLIGMGTMDMIDTRSYIFKYANDIILASRGVYIYEFVPKGLDSQRTHRSHGYETGTLCFYKLDVRTKSWNMFPGLIPEEIAVFVGNSASMAISASEAGCVGGTYYTDDWGKYYQLAPTKLGGLDASHCNRKTLCQALSFASCQQRDKRSSYCCPFWFQPSR